MSADPVGEWAWSDAWVLAAAPDTPTGCSLSDLIRTADGINHAIVTLDELADGLGALLAAGLLEVRGDHFRTTAAGQAIKKHWKGGLFGWSRTVLPHLRTLPRPRERFEISRADYDAAVTKYLRRVPR